MWDERNGTDLDARYKAGVENLQWKYKLYDMCAGHEFDGGVYTKGKYFLHALRRKLGDDAYYTALRDIQLKYARGNLSLPGRGHPGAVGREPLPGFAGRLTRS
ncbi:MAG TPA: hypothetical protein VGJ44_16295 [Kribbellaceae bacterium]